MVTDAPTPRTRLAPHAVSVRFSRLLLAAIVSSILPACSTFQLGRPEPGIENSHVQSVRSLVAVEARLLEPAERVRVADVLLDAEREHGLDPYLVMAVIEHESRWQPGAVGVSGSIGLLQVQPRTGAEVAARLGLRWAGARTLRDPVANVTIGVAYLAELHERFDRRAALTLAAYNVGPARVDQILGSGRQPRTVYSSSVLRRHERLRESGSASIASTGL